MSLSIFRIKSNNFENLLFAFSTRRGWFIPGRLSSRNPSSKNDCSIEPPNFLMIWIESSVAFGSSEHYPVILRTRKKNLNQKPLILRMALTQISAKKSLCCVSSLELSVVRAMLNRSVLNFSASFWLSCAVASNASRAAATAFFQPL